MIRMFLHDEHVYLTWGEAPREDGLVVSRHELAGEVGYINAHGIHALEITTGNPRIYVDQAFRETLLAQVQTDTAEPADDYLTDLTPLRHCPQLVWLSLEGDLIGSEVLADLPALRMLSIDNSLGKHPVNLSCLMLQSLYIQKPGRNVRGFEQITPLQELAIWNYQPGSRDLTELHRLTRLRTLRLIRPRIDTLAGVERLPALETLKISYTRTLTDASAIHRCPNAVKLVLDHVPNLPQP